MENNTLTLRNFIEKVNNKIEGSKHARVDKHEIRRDGYDAYYLSDKIWKKDTEAEEAGEQVATCAPEGKIYLVRQDRAYGKCGEYIPHLFNVFPWEKYVDREKVKEMFDGGEDVYLHDNLGEIRFFEGCVSQEDYLNWVDEYLKEANSDEEMIKANSCPLTLDAPHHCEFVINFMNRFEFIEYYVLDLPAELTKETAKELGKELSDIFTKSIGEAKKSLKEELNDDEVMTKEEFIEKLNEYIAYAYGKQYVDGFEFKLSGSERRSAIICGRDALIREIGGVKVEDFKPFDIAKVTVKIHPESGEQVLSLVKKCDEENEEVKAKAVAEMIEYCLDVLNKELLNNEEFTEEYSTEWFVGKNRGPENRIDMEEDGKLHYVEYYEFDMPAKLNLKAAKNMCRDMLNGGYR